MIYKNEERSITMGKFILKRTPAGFHFVLVADNGETILVSELYTTKCACQNGIESIRANAMSAKVEDQTINGYTSLMHPKYEIFMDKAGEYRFRLKAKNGEGIGVSEGYGNKQNCKDGIESVRRVGPWAEVNFVSEAKVG